MSSLPFDRAVPYYDKTRANPEWVQRAIINSIVEETGVTPHSRILEVGIGTGRIGIPLLERGYPLVGADLSLEMLLELQNKGEGRNFRLALVQADALVLPWQDERFDLVYAVHVYHLIQNWQSALAEAHRVLRAGGWLMVSFHYRDPALPNRVLRSKLGEMAREFGVNTKRPGVQFSRDVLAEMTRWGKPKAVEVARWVEKTTAGQIVDDIAAQIYSDTWLIPPDLLKQLVPRLREWARSYFGDLTRELEEDAPFSWMMVCKT